MVKDAPPLNPTRAQARVAAAAEAIYLYPPDPQELAFLARELVQCTLPHSDPGQVSFWARTNGNMTLSIVSGFDPRKTRLVGYPIRQHSATDPLLGDDRGAQDPQPPP